MWLRHVPASDQTEDSPKVNNLIGVYAASFAALIAAVVLLISLTVLAADSIKARRRRYRHPQGYLWLPVLHCGDEVQWYTRRGMRGVVQRVWNDGPHPMIAVMWEDGMVTTIDRELVVRRKAKRGVFQSGL